MEQIWDSELDIPQEEGNHIFNIRVKDENGDWGSVFSKIVLVYTGYEDSRDIQIQQAEFFWNDDPGEGSATTILSFDGDLNEAVEQVFQSEIPLPEEEGVHIFSIRVMDENGTWSSTFSKAVLLDAGAYIERFMEIQEGEYFWDEDPGEGQGTTLLAIDGQFGEAIEGVFDNMASLEQEGFPNAGFHIFNLRVTDENDIWSSIFSKLVRIRSWVLSEAAINNDQICQGESVQLEILGGLDYVWSPSTGLNITEGSIVNANPTTTTNYMIVGSGPNNYTDTTYYALTVLETPSIISSVITDPTCDICEDGSIDITIESNNPYTINWYSNNFESQNEDLNNISGGTYFVTIENENGCSYSESFTLIIEGCTDELACNYDETATNDNGSCEYAEEYYDCDGGPINDSDNDGIPDELEIPGCTDPLACNYNAYAIQDDGSCIFPSDCGDCESIGVTHSIQLNSNSGWNLFSTYICPFEPNIDSIMEELVNNNNLYLVKDGDGNVYWPAFNLNTIGNLEIGKGYLLKVQDQAILNIYGTVLNYNDTINIQSGWSYLGYLHQECYNVVDMMEPIVSELILMKDGVGDVYWPYFNLNYIGNMCPGQGYQIKMINSSIFNFPNPDGARYGHFSKNRTVHFEKASNTGNNMTIGLPLTSWESTPSIGDEIAAYGEDGELIGSTTFQGDHIALTVWGDDLTTDKKDGISEGEAISFKLWNSQTGVEQTLEVRWTQGVGFYTTDGISIAGQIILGSELTTEKQLVKITDMLGREVNGDEKDVMLLYIYDDGSIERVFIKE